MKYIDLVDAVQEPVSHGDSGIMKQVIIPGNEIPVSTNFSRVLVHPGQSCEEHSHPTKYEVSHVIYGKGIFTVEGKDMVLGDGDTIVVEPGERHCVKNPLGMPLVYLCFGIATDES